MSTFSRPQRRKATDASEAFLSGATAAAIEPSAPTPAPAAPSSDDAREPFITSQTVRFTAREKAALQRLSKAQKRSEHFVIKEILGPALLDAERRLSAAE